MKPAIEIPGRPAHRWSTGPAASGRTLPVVDPSIEEVVAEIPAGDATDVA